MPGTIGCIIQSGEALTTSDQSESSCATAHLRLTPRRVEGPDSALIKNELATRRFDLTRGRVDGQNG